MAHFAHIDDNNNVIGVIVAEQDFIDSGVLGDPSKWIQTSYNTHAGIHRLGGTPLRKNFAGIGMIYDASRDAFMLPQPYSSWTLNESTCQWESPIAIPAYHDDYVYVWNESTLSWDQNPR